MSRKMLINVLHPEEARVAIVSDGKLMDLNIEISGKEQTKGYIYKGVVMRVEPSLQAAFVDIGQAKPGFIQMGDIHPTTWLWRDDLPEEDRPKRPRIQDIMRRGQELLVQVEKDAREMKGAALTGYISLPGRYMVLMPGDSAAGISRKIEDGSIRRELKSQIGEIAVPEGYGYIVRTEAVGHTTEELRADLDYLVGIHTGISEAYAQKPGAGLIYQDAGVIIRSIRDYFSDDIDEILVDDKEAFQQAVTFLKQIAPGMEKRVKLHREKRPIFSKYQLEEQIDQLYEKRVSLPSGGYLIIEPTEALVSIDVNSGKSSGERGVEDTAFKTNVEAAAEVARQLRLRDLGGLVVIDFIDMRDHRHNKEVEQTLKEALKADKARVNLGRISQFGMLEMSRQRIAKNIHDAIHLECPHCEGRGRVKSVEAMALSFLRKVHAAAAKGQLSEVRGGLPLEVAYYLLNRKKRELAQIENDYEIVVTVKGKPSFLLNQLDLEVVKKEKTREEAVTPVAAQPVVAEPVINGTDEPSEAVAGAVKKKRKRKRRKKTDERDTTATVVESDDNDQSVALEESSLGTESENQELSVSEEAEPLEDSADSGEVPEKKRKSRRSRSRKKPEIEVEILVAPDDSSPASEEAHLQIPAPVESPAPKGRKPRKPTAAKKAVQSADEEQSDAAAEQPQKPTRGRATRKTSAEPDTQEAVAGETAETQSSGKRPAAKRPRVSKSKKAAEIKEDSNQE